MQPTILRAVTTDHIAPIPKHNLISFNEKGEPLLLLDAGLNYDDIKLLIDNGDGILFHITDTKSHWSSADRRDYELLTKLVNEHVTEREVHVTLEDKNKWNSMETPEEAQLKMNSVIELLNIHAANMDLHVTKREKDRWNNTYTREEVSKLVSTVHSNTVWRDPVDTYDDLAVIYTNAENGWVCTVKDTNISYIYQEDYTDPNTGLIADKWIPWGLSVIPDATETQSGKMSAAMVTKLQSIEANANYYVHPDTPFCRHVTDIEKKLWNNKASKDLVTIFSPGLMSSADKEKLDTIEKYANSFDLPEDIEANRILTDDQHMFVTRAERDKIALATTSELANDERDGLMSKDNFLKLYNIEAGANKYIHPAKHSATDIAQDTLHRFVTDSQVHEWDNKETVMQAQYKADRAERNANEYTDQKIKDLVGAAPEALDTLADIAEALNNSEDFAAIMTLELSNKVCFQEYDNHVNNLVTHMSTQDRAKFNSIEENANYYIHPAQHNPNDILQDFDHQFVTATEKAEWNGKANGDPVTETKPGQMTPDMLRKLNNITTTGMITSDWNETDENSGSYIRNKPTTMKAHGGDCDTVEGYTIDEITNAKKSATIVIGVEGYCTDKDVDIYCSVDGAGRFIDTAVEQLPSTGGTILFREGIYNIEKPLNYERIGVTFKASGPVTFKTITADSMDILSIDGINNTIDGITFTGFDQHDGSFHQDALSITGNSNTVQNCSFNDLCHGIHVSGSMNRITNNTLTQINQMGIILEATERDTQYGNMITNNHFINSNDFGYCAIVIYGGETEENSMNNNIITGNFILDFYNGIRVESPTMVNSCNNNLISNNTIMRGTGLSSDYLFEQHTVRICNGSWNLVTGNILKGREAVNNSDSTNVISNNISV